MLPPRAVVLLELLASHAWSWQLLSSTNVPSYLSSGCVEALTQDVGDCSPMVSRLINGYFYPESTLQRTCNATCSASLGKFEESIASACNGESWGDYFNADETGEDAYSMPLRMIPALTRYLFNLTCLEDSGRWCNVVAATSAMIADPGNSMFNWADIVANDTVAPSPCDMCFIKRLGMQAGSPFYEGPRLASMSLYASLTSSCSVTDMPMTTSTLGFSTPTVSAPTAPTCVGKTYTLKAGDDCYSVSSSQGIGTSWLLSDNNLGAYCSDFPTSGELCLVNTCKTYVVPANDTCNGIATRSNITVPQLKAWNPAIDLGCYNIVTMNGTSICVSSPGKSFVAPSVTIDLPPSTPTAAVPVPSDVAEGSTTYCGQYYSVQEGDYCNLLSIRFGISLQDFVILNPNVNDNCTNLFANESYCVAAVGDINTYPGQPGHHLGTSTTSATGPTTAFEDLPDATMEPYPRANDTRLPLADHTRDDCAKYFDGSLLADLDLDTGDNSLVITPCSVAAELFFADIEALGVWNPSLGNTTLSNCTFEPTLRYCGQLYWNATEPDTGDELIYELEIREGFVEECTQFDDVPVGWTCNDVLGYYQMTIGEFYKLNPEVGEDCGNLWAGYAYCTSTDANPGGEIPDPPISTTKSASSASSTSTSTATGPVPPAATQEGQPADCNKWGVVGDGDGCSSLANDAGITLEQFYAWNPAVSSDCTLGLWPDYAYCVGVTSSTIPTTTASTALNPTPTGPTAPGQTQSGQVSNCNKWDEAISGDSCWAISDRNTVSLADLYGWNSVLEGGEACGTQIWPTYYYCVGVSQ